MKRSGIEALDRYIGGLERLARLDVPGAHERKRAYESIRALISTRSLQGEWAPPLGFEGIAASSIMRDLLGAARVAFMPRASKGELVDSLKDFQGTLRQSGALSFPEGRLLFGAADHWLQCLQVEPFEAALRIQLAVSLDLSQQEEGNTVGVFSTALVPVLITRSGFSPVAEIKLHVQVGEGIELESNDSDQVWPKLLTDIRSGREIAEISYRGEGLAEVWLEYKPLASSSKVARSNILKVRLIQPEQSGNPGEMAALQNPYVPDLPLFSDRQWETLVMGEHGNLLAELRSSEYLRQGTALIVRGCRRTGKTTLLRRLKMEEEREAGLLVVYVDIYLWFLELSGQDKDDCIDDRALFYEFCRAALIEAEMFAEEMRDRAEIDDEEESLILDGLQEVRDYIEASSTGMKLPPQAFDKAMVDIGGIVKRKILLIIDELDWWINKMLSDGNAEAFLRVLSEMAKRRQAFSVLLSHDLTSSGWDRRLGQDREKEDAQPFSRRTRFLSRTVLESLASVAEGVAFSSMAIDSIWRISGGWPGLATLIYYEAVEVARSKGVRGVDVGIVKRAVRNLLEQEDYQKFVSYLLVSISEEELAVLSLLVKSEIIQETTGFIRWLQLQPGDHYMFKPPSAIELRFHKVSRLSDLLRSLKDKEIIDEVEGGHGSMRLRVGLFAYPLIYDLKVWRE